MKEETRFSSRLPDGWGTGLLLGVQLLWKGKAAGNRAGPDR